MWRSMKAEDREEFLGWAEQALSARWQLGADLYHSDVRGFQGDPIDHAIEEALDLVLYLFMTKRKYS